MTLTFVSLPGLAPREGPSVPAPTAAAQGAPQRISQGAWSATGSATALVGAAASVILANNRKQGRKTSLSAMPPTVDEVPEWMKGTGGPRPEDFFDPAGLARGASEEKLLELRAQEIKHGRTAMLAVLGWFHTSAGVHYIGDAAARTTVSDNSLISATQVPFAAWLQIFFTLMCFEWMFTYVVKPPKNRPWDLLGWTPVIADENYPDWKETQLRELNNGRLAMIGFVGLVAQDLYTGNDPACGLSKYAFGNKIGEEGLIGQTAFKLFGIIPVGFWDLDTDVKLLPPP
jgi:hypothetical protein